MFSRSRAHSSCDTPTGVAFARRGLPERRGRSEACHAATSACDRPAPRENVGAFSVCRSYLDVVRESDLVAGRAAKTPILPWCFGNRDFYVRNGDTKFMLKTFEEEPDEAFFRLHGTTFKHADLDDRVTLRAAGRIKEIFCTQREETMSALIHGKL